MDCMAFPHQEGCYEESLALYYYIWIVYLITAYTIHVVLFVTLLHVYTEGSWTLTTKVVFVACLFLLTLMFALFPMLIIKSYQTERDPSKQTR